MTLYSLIIINKAGGLIYHCNFQNSIHSSLSSNEYLVIASTFQSVHAISSQIHPNSSGIKMIECVECRYYLMETATGIKFILSSDRVFSESYTERHVLPKIYELYTDFVLKNPFYTLEMPIKCPLFDVQLQKYTQSF